MVLLASNFMLKIHAIKILDEFLNNNRRWTYHIYNTIMGRCIDLRKGIYKTLQEQDLELVEQVMNVMGNEIFIFLDLFLFTVLLGVILFISNHTWVYFLLIPFGFFLIFTFLYKIFKL